MTNSRKFSLIQFISMCKNIEILFLLIVLILLYRNVIHYDFVWDDVFLIRTNPYLDKPFHFLEIFNASFWKFSSVPDNPVPYYRPLVTLAYLLEYKMFGLFAGGYHFIALLLHLSNVVLIWFIARRFDFGRVGSFVCALIFGLHPTQIHTVCFISCHGDLLATLFLLLAVGFWTNQKKIQYVALVFAFLAMLSKEIGIITPMILFAYDVVIAKNRSRQKWLPMLVWIPYFILRYNGLSHIAHYTVTTPWLWNSYGSLKTLLLLNRTFFPLPYAPEIFVPEIKIWIRVLLHAAYALLLVFAIMMSRRNSLLLFFTIWFFLSLFLVGDWFGYRIRLSDQFIYAPMISIALICGWTAQHYKKSVYFFALLGIGFLIASPRPIAAWLDSITLWSNALDHNPGNPRFVTNYTYALLDQAHYKQSCEWTKNADKILNGKKNPYLQCLTLTNLGSCSLKNDPRAAEDYYLAALQLHEHYPARLGLIHALMNQGKIRLAVEHAKKLTETYPDKFESWQILADSLLQAGDIPGSNRAMQQGLSILAN